MRKQKEIGIVVIIHNQMLLLESFQHEQGYEILSVPGAPKDEVPERIVEILGEGFRGKEKPFGSFVDLIVKSEGEVELRGAVHRVEVSDISQVSLPKGFDWYTKNQIENDPRCQRDRRLYLRLLEQKSLHIEYSEEQHGLWREARIRFWNEGEQE